MVLVCLITVIVIFSSYFLGEQFIVFLFLLYPKVQASSPETSAECILIT